MTSKPGAPVIKEVDKEKLIARLLVSVPGASTQKAFAASCDLFNQEVKQRGIAAPGFRPGATLPSKYLFEMFGEDQVKGLCASLLAADIQEQCALSQLQLVGRGRVVDFRTKDFQPGADHELEVECDLWPVIAYKGEAPGYRGLKVTVRRAVEDTDKVEKVRQNIREKYAVLSEMPADYRAAEGDVVTVDMQGFAKAADGSKGEALPDIARGGDVDITLEKGRFMEGMVESLLGSAEGERRLVAVRFPERMRGPGAALSGQEALFEVTVKKVKSRTLPAWDGQLAGRIREGLSLSQLEEEVEQAVHGEASTSLEARRNDALANALLEATVIEKLPESLVEENTQGRFQNMLMDFRAQGSTPEQLQEMSSPENYDKYKALSRKNVEKTVALGLVFRDIADRESLRVQEEEVQEQLNLLRAQAKQKKSDGPIDEEQAREEIESVLLRKKVFDYLAQHAVITLLDPEPSTPPPPPALATSAASASA